MQDFKPNQTNLKKKIIVIKIDLMQNLILSMNIIFLIF